MFFGVNRLWRNVRRFPLEGIAAVALGAGMLTVPTAATTAMAQPVPQPSMQSGVKSSAATARRDIDDKDSSTVDEKGGGVGSLADPYGLLPEKFFTVDAIENTMPLAKDDSADGFCERDSVVSSFQRCSIYSAAMKRFIEVQFKPSARGSHAALLLLDGASAVESHNRWINMGGAGRNFSNTDINILAPVGGGASWYADWQYPNCSLVHRNSWQQKWETFITRELRSWARWAAGVHPSLYSAAGFSMGGGSAMMLAERHNDMIQQVLSFSGQTTFAWPGLQPFINLTSDASPCVLSPFGSVVNPSRYEYDPILNIDKLRGRDVYAVAATGIIKESESAEEFARDAVNAPWEMGAAIMLKAFEDAAALHKVPVEVEYIPRGTHTYQDARGLLLNQRNRILLYMHRQERALEGTADPLHRPKYRRLAQEGWEHWRKGHTMQDVTSEDAQQQLQEWKKNKIFRDGATELVDRYGEEAVVCAIHREGIAWTRSIPAHPVVNEGTMWQCQADLLHNSELTDSHPPAKDAQKKTRGSQQKQAPARKEH